MLTIQEMQDLKVQNPYLYPIEPGENPTVLGAKNIRTLLKLHFPGVKFSVRSRAFAGGTSIDVRWEDGPTSAQVETIMDQFKTRDFDGQTDSLSYRHSKFTELFGGASFVMGHRDRGDGVNQIVKNLGFKDFESCALDEQELILDTWSNTDFSQKNASLNLF